MEFPLTRLVANFLILLTCLVPFIPLIILFIVEWRRKQKRVGWMAPLVKKAGFQPVSVLGSILNRDNALFQTPDRRFTVSLISEPYSENGHLLDFVRFNIFLPPFDQCLICSPHLSNYIGQLLYETYWKRTFLNTLEPLGLSIVCERSRADQLHYKLAQPIFIEIFKPLLESRQIFFILSDSPEFFTVAFAIQSPETQRTVLWLDFLRRFSEAWALPTSAPKRPNRTAVFNLFTLLVLIMMLGVVAVLFGWFNLV